MREAKLMAAVGKKGCGKTYQTDLLIRNYITGNPQTGTPPRRALILDVNDEFVQYPAILLENVELFSVHSRIECRRIRPLKEDGTKMTLNDIANALFQILGCYKNGLLLIEDVNKYISDNMPNDLIGAICTNRHSAVDIILHYQSLSRITPKVWQNLNILRYHKCADSVERHKNKFEDKYEYLSIAESIIDTKYFNGDKRFFVTIDIDDEKIYGDYTNQEFNNAIDTYLQNNYNALITPMLKSKGFSGKKNYTAESAVKEVKSKIIQLYRPSN